MDTFTSYLSTDTSSLQNQTMVSLPQTSSLPAKPSKTRLVQKPTPSFWNRMGSHLRSMSCDFSNDTHSLVKTESKKTTSSSAPLQSASRRDSVSNSSKESNSPTIYQLWVELNRAEHLIVHNSDLTPFRKYLINKEYAKLSESAFAPPDDVKDGYYLIAETKIEAQYRAIRKLFEMKKAELSAQQSSEERAELDEAFKAFKTFYKNQFERAKQHSKSK